MVSGSADRVADVVPQASGKAGTLSALNTQILCSSRLSEGKSSPTKYPVLSEQGTVASVQHSK